MPFDEPQNLLIYRPHSDDRPREREATGRQDMPGWESLTAPFCLCLTTGA